MLFYLRLDLTYVALLHFLKVIQSKSLCLAAFLTYMGTASNNKKKKNEKREVNTGLCFTSVTYDFTRDRLERVCS